ncbi:MAG: hypothetical protein J0653_07925, partial [Deltaproteobacteria bacterium]|nr:hypothetical protein [Deltaproteobacteria bacterium]
MKRKIQIFLLAVFGFMGLVSGFLSSRTVAESTGWSLFSAILISVTIFYWYRIDSAEKEFRRPFLLSVGVVAFAPLAIPLYVFSSTVRGLRLLALGRLLGYSCLLIFLSFVGGMAG